MEEPAQELQDTGQYACPECSEIVSVPEGESPRLIQCPHCGTQFFVSDEDPAEEQEDQDQTPEDEDDELNALRIRQVSGIRRTLIRTRSYFLVGAATCLIAAIQLVLNAIQQVRARGLHARPIILLVIAVLLTCAAFYFARRAGEINRELRRSLLPEPTTPPDFSTLSDGSQYWKNLEKMSLD